MSWPSIIATLDVSYRRRMALRNVISSSAGEVVSRSSPRLSRFLSLAFKVSSPSSTVGESLVILCLAKDREQARIVFRYVKAILNHIPALKAMIITERADEVELSTGVTIMSQASDFGGVRGPTIAAAVLDELAFWPSEGANPDNAVISAVRPAMIIPSAKLLCISTGYAQTGTLYDAHRRYFGKDNDDGVLVWRSNSHSMNPSISAEFVQAEIEKDPDAARSEWLGMFREDVTTAFPLELIEGCIVPGRVELPYIPGVRYQSFDDVSGGRSDSWAKAVAHIERGVIVIDCLAYWGPPFDPGLIAQESAAIRNATTAPDHRRPLRGRMADCRVPKARHPLHYRREIQKRIVPEPDSPNVWAQGRAAGR